MYCCKVKTACVLTKVDRPDAKLIGQHPGYVRRTRVCKVCAKRISTIEIPFSEFMPGRSGLQESRPLPTLAKGTKTLVDIETRLEDLLTHAIDAIKKVLVAPDGGGKAATIKADVARWLISDRRAYREEIASSGQKTDDTAINELRNVLTLIKKPAASE
tara:strand:- start:363 stop:839 length:477 start_codon:yes stop_codon:yes gene_type:complete